MKVIRETTYWAEIEGHRLRLVYDPSPNIEPYLSVDGDTLTLRYAIPNEDASDPIEDDETVDVQWCVTWPLTERQFLIERDERGYVLYSITEERTPLTVGVLTLDEDWIGDPAEIARGIMDRYTDWANGSTYALVSQCYHRQPDGGWLLDKDSLEMVGGFTGEAEIEDAVQQGDY